MSIKIKVFPVNAFREVTYVVSDQTKEAVIIDAGANAKSEFERIFKYIEENELKPTTLINTHGHIDHMLGVEVFKQKYKIPFAISAKDTILLNDAKDRAAMFGFDPDMVTVPSIDINLDDMEEVTFGETTLKVIPTPGHSLGGVCLYEPNDKVLFSGDTLFQGSIGRTDLPGGDYDQLMNSIVNDILPLGGDVKVYPGHGNHTTLAHEAMYNPFISEVLTGEANYQKL